LTVPYAPLDIQGLDNTEPDVIEMMDELNSTTTATTWSKLQGKRFMANASWQLLTSKAKLENVAMPE
jgi:hypothetical protein